MAVSPDPPALQDVAERLEGLLERARGLKNSITIDPALPAAEFEGGRGLPPSDVSQKTHFAAVEVATKRIFQSRIAAADIHDAEFGEIWNLLDIIQILCDQDQCEPVLLWYLIEELLDCQSIEGCRTVFDYLESRGERLVAKHFSKVSLVILRACNELLRRLSKAEDSVFCGRVFIYVFQTFPLHDRSSVNRQGDYNSENVTTFDDPPEKDGKDQDVSMTEDPADGADGQPDDKPKPVAQADELYAVFWGLQKSFAYPPRVFDPTALDEFKKGFEATLAKFKDMPKVMAESVRMDAKRKADFGDQEEFASSFNPKYLTSRELFELELSDLAFQRHILVQGLILLDFLLSFTEKTKKKLGAKKGAVKAQFTLSEADTEWVIQTKRSIVAALRDGSDGPAFARVVDTVLSRDKNWVRWKEDNCPEISRQPVPPESFAEATERSRVTCSWKRLRTTPLGSLDLKFLGDASSDGGVDRLADPARYSLPKAETLVQKVVEVELDLDFATEEEKRPLLESKATKTWKTLRIASRSNLSGFDKVQNGTGLDGLASGAGNVPGSKKDDDQEIRGGDETTHPAAT